MAAQSRPVFAASVLGLLVAAWTATPVQAGGTVVFFGGLNQADLGGKAEDFGQQLTAGLQDLLGGTWSSSQTRQGGLDMGAGYRIDQSPTVAIQLEVQFVRRGTKYELNARNVPDFPPSVDVDIGLKLHYLELLALAYYTPSPAARVRPVLLVGPVLGVEIGSDLQVSMQGDSDSAELTSGVAGTTFGLLGGAGLAFQAGASSSLFVQARYYLGMTDLLSNWDNSRAQDLGLLVGMEFVVGP